MSEVENVKEAVIQRLAAAANEIFGLLEKTVAEYEEELHLSKQENERQRKLLNVILNPQLRLRRAGEFDPILTE